MLHRIIKNAHEYVYVDVDDDGDAVLLEKYHRGHVGWSMGCVCNECWGRTETIAVAKQALAHGVKRLYVSQGDSNWRHHLYKEGCDVVWRCFDYGDAPKEKSITKWAERVASEVTFIEAQEQFLAGLT